MAILKGLAHDFQHTAAKLWKFIQEQDVVPCWTNEPPLHNELLRQRLELLTGIRNNMKNRFRRFWNKLMLRKRSLIETVNERLKHISQIEHARHGSRQGFMVNLAVRLIAYTYHPKKPSLGLRGAAAISDDGLNRVPWVAAPFLASPGEHRLEVNVLTRSDRRRP